MSEFRLGIHGVPHWSRVYTNARKLAEAERARDPSIYISEDVIKLFSFLHDHVRENDGSDPEHGERAAGGAVLLRGIYFDIEDHEMEMLVHAMTFHSDGMTMAEPTVQVCWDADRLDLGRVGKYPNQQYLCTESAKDPEFIQQAFNRSLK